MHTHTQAASVYHIITGRQREHGAMQADTAAGHSAAGEQDYSLLMVNVGTSSMKGDRRCWSLTSDYIYHDRFNYKV